MSEEDSPGRWDRRRLAEERWRQALAEHDEYVFAHSAERHQQNNDWAGRVLQRDADLRLMENRLAAVERFRAQATMIGAIAMVVLGAVTYAVIDKLIL